MTNLTSSFKECIKIISENGPPEKDAKAEHADVKEYMLKDSFIKECRQLLRLLIELRKVLKSVEPKYMSEKDMTESDKDEFDTEFRLQFHQYVQKFKLLEQYEHQRQEIVKQKFLTPHAHMIHLFHGNLSPKVSIYHQGNNDYRSGVLKSLSMWLSIVSSQFSNMQQERLVSQRKFETLDLNTGLAEPADFVSISSASQSHPVETIQEEVKIYEDTISKLTQEQLQMLETEHEELLNQKNEQLKKVEKINSTIMDIVSLQSDISANLQVQSQNINSILDSQEDVDLNIKEGNKQLTKAKRAAGRTAKMTTAVAIILGILIIFLDYVG